MYLNDEGIEVLHQPAAHTDGDSIVFFRRSDVVVAGDIIDTRHFTVIDVARGGSVQGEIAALNKLVELAIPPGADQYSREAGTLVITGHGRIYDQTDVRELPGHGHHYSGSYRQLDQAGEDPPRDQGLGTNQGIRAAVWV